MEQYGAGDYFNPWMPHDPFPNRYNQNWETHSDLSWRNQIGQNSVGQFPGFQQNQKSSLESLVEKFVLAQECSWNWGNHSDFFWNSRIGQSSIRPSPEFSQQQGQKSNLEMLMENFISSQTKLNEEFRQQNQEMCDAIIQLGAKVDSLATHNAMLETHIAQQASNFDDEASIFYDEAEFDLSNPINHPSVEGSCYEFFDTLHQITEEGTPICHPENPPLEEGSFENNQAAEGIHLQEDSPTLPWVEIKEPETHPRELETHLQVFPHETVKTWDKEGGTLDSQAEGISNGQRLSQHHATEPVGQAVPYALIKPFDPGGPKRGQA